jgi:hypothetical protein
VFYVSLTHNLQHSHPLLLVAIFYRHTNPVLFRKCGNATMARREDVMFGKFG